MSDRLTASEWLVRPIEAHGEAHRLIRTWHYSRSAPNTSTYRHGLYRSADILCGDAYGVALWIPPIHAAARAISPDRFRGVLSLSRLALDPCVPVNGASFLLGRSMQQIDRTRWPVLVTYADTALGHTGAIYKATNWRCDGEVKAGDVWIDPTGARCGRKRGPRTFTRGEMLAMGMVPAPSMPKIRFVHEVAS